MPTEGFIEPLDYLLQDWHLELPPDANPRNSPGLAQVEHAITPLNDHSRGMNRDESTSTDQLGQLKYTGPHQPRIVDIPFDIIMVMSRFMSATEVMNLLSSCRKLHSFIDEESIWLHFCSRYGVRDRQPFVGRSFKEIYTCLLHTYGPLLGTWAGNHPPIGNILEFRLQLGPGMPAAGIVGEIWHFDRGLPNKSRLFDDLTRTAVVLITFPDPSLGITVVHPSRYAQVYCCGDMSRRIVRPPTEWHEASLHTLSRLATLTNTDIVSGRYKYPDFPGASSWYDVLRPFPRLHPLVQVTPNESTSTYVRDRDVTAKPCAITLGCPSGDSYISSYSHRAMSDLGDLPATYYFPLCTEVVRGIPPESVEWTPASLRGLWLGDYAEVGTECIHVEVDEGSSTLRGWKVTGDVFVPRGTTTWDIHIGVPLDINEDGWRIPALLEHSEVHQVYCGAMRFGNGYTDTYVNTLAFLAVTGPDDMTVLSSDGRKFTYTRYREKHSSRKS
ncbi:hypothetical protein POSPLADRAFT_1136065 [Postia placenta MAD-698-R-SB12]|uniref:F-box domain-containing protein n=1 Tax=Postia placenta MAD-698-R-SB12 TaxID=670580 RepID=A0A1X6NAK5_9APHY|nr:hypothetical protein POSPLADRAFT_1136065 [Postia placenta MAD-698-R-SB12]OSX65678.1 hypothetical protein POSPLADRAFT_1136065 [Postia placenta MAD-698-R-SB12]